MTFDPKSVEVTCDPTQGSLCPSPMKYIKVCGNSDPFSKTGTKGHWPIGDLCPHLLRSHVWLYPRIIVSKSHGNSSMYVDTVINFAKCHIHTHTTYYIHTYILRTTYRMNDHIVSFWTQFRRDNNNNKKNDNDDGGGEDDDDDDDDCFLTPFSIQNYISLLFFVLIGSLITTSFSQIVLNGNWNIVKIKILKIKICWLLYFNLTTIWNTWIM